MAVIGGFRYNLSITRKADGTFLQVFCFPKTVVKRFFQDLSCNISLLNELSCNVFFPFYFSDTEMHV